ncbi:MAG: hypothetical protein MUP66_03160 [Candidatus Nanohaloarchaeota archaeon QJJ-5]|nr:hypothetical protein [Candidatus Nanohaloarchaeota archaeon QJJ-5]
MLKINSLEQDDYQAVFRWDEYQEEDPRFLQGVMMEHFQRHDYGDERFRAEDGTIKLMFDDSPGTEQRTHSMLVTESDIYSKIETDGFPYDPEQEDARHISIMQDRMDALHGRAQAAQSIYETVASMDEQADTILEMLEDGPITDETEFEQRCDTYGIDKSEIEAILDEEPVVFPDTEQRSRQRSIDDYDRTTVKGESMRDIYDNVIDVVAAAYHQDQYFA